MFVRSFVVSVLLAIPGCGSGELAPLPATHPASAQADEAPSSPPASSSVGTREALAEGVDASPAHDHAHGHSHGPAGHSQASPAPSSLGGASAPAAATQAYVCPMHAEVTSSSPGDCPKCGMKLVPVKKP